MKKQLTRAGFFLLTIITILYLNSVLSVKSWHGIDQARAMYVQPRNSIDVVMMGSSHIHCNIDTGVLWNHYGIAAFNYCAAQQPLWMTYHYLIEFCKYQTPKVVVIDLYSPALRKEDYQYDWINQSLYGMRFSLNKVQMLLASVERHRISEYFPSFFNYHDRYTELEPEEWLYPITMRDELMSFKGFTPYLNRVPQERPALTQDESGGISIKSEQYLKQIIEFTQARGIELFLIVSPYISNENEEYVFNRIEEIARDYRVHFRNMNYDYDEIGLDFDADFNDESHLNYWGAYKFTSFLGEELHTRFELPDRRGDPRYHSWQENFEEIDAYVRENAPGEEMPNDLERPTD